MNHARTFVDLLSTPTDLEEWIAAFCSRQVMKPTITPPFPDLDPGQTAATWLIGQFHELASTPGARDRLREAIVRIIIAQGGRKASPETCDQIVGTLLEVAGPLKFVEITGQLAGWVRKSWFRDTRTYRLGRTEVSLRRIVWSLLLAWGAVDDVLPQLAIELHDLAKSSEIGTAKLYYVALGQRKPEQALRLMPDLANKWHEEYWEGAVLQFLRSVDPRILVSPDLEDAWTECVGRCLYNERVSTRLRDQLPFTEADSHRANPLFKVLLRADLELSGTGSNMELRGGGATLHLNIGRYTEEWAIHAPFPDEAEVVANR